MDEIDRYEFRIALFKTLLWLTIVVSVVVSIAGIFWCDTVASYLESEVIFLMGISFLVLKIKEIIKKEKENLSLLKK